MSFSPDHVSRALRHLRKSDPILADVIRRVGPFRLKPRRGRFQSLVRSILAQQISTAVARSMLRKLEATLSPDKLTPESLGQLSFDNLRSIGLSRQKASYLQDLTEKVLDGTVRLHRVHRLTDDEIIDELIQIKGIGRWTVQMFLIFCLGRPNVFAPDDFGLRSAIQRLYDLPELPKRAEAEEIAAPWRPHGTVASWYLWRSLELADEED
jgi:DNA-3-methyladenine glycosylase II